MRVVENIIRSANYSKETDLCLKLHSELFGEKLNAQPNRMKSGAMLSDNDLEFIHAAGMPVPSVEDMTGGCQMGTAPQKH